MDEPYARPGRAEIAARLGVPDDERYMSVGLFAALPSGVHHAVWKALAEGRIDAVPAEPGTPNGILRYDRAQVVAIMAGLAGAQVAPWLT